MLDRSLERLFQMSKNIQGNYMNHLQIQIFIKKLRMTGEGIEAESGEGIEAESGEGIEAGKKLNFMRNRKNFVK